MNNQQIELTLVVPAYNEEKRIGTSLDKIKNYLSSVSFLYEVLVINDGSSDNTSLIVSGYKDKLLNFNIIENERNMGKGYSVKKGVIEARGKYIIFTDADLSTPIEETEKLLTVLRNGYDVAIGSRHISGADIRLKQPFHRQIMGRMFNFFVRLCAIPSIHDTQCGFKGFKNESAKHIFNFIDTYGYSFDVEVLYLAHKFGLKIKEIPIVWYDSPSSRINPITDPIKMFLDVLKIRWKHRITNGIDSL